MGLDLPRAEHAGRRRLLAGLSVGALLVVGAVALPLPGSGSPYSLPVQTEVDAMAKGLPHTDLPQMPLHTHDPAMKNEIARSGELTRNAVDPTTPAQARRNTAYVASERKLPDPQLTTRPAYQPRRLSPQSRYAMANGCYALSTGTGRYVTRTGTSYVVSRTTAKKAYPFYFKPTTLGHYLLYGHDRTFLGAVSSSAGTDASPGTDTEWTVRSTGRSVRSSHGGRAHLFTLTLPGKRPLAVKGTSLSLGARATPLLLERTTGCTAYPESQIDVEGDPTAGVTPYQEVRGYVDGHSHGMAFEFLGGDVHCGRPWHKYGAPFALRDCPDHIATGGVSAIGAVLEGKPKHDPVGWPTFKDWPAPDSLEHEGTYYRWMERSWRGGQRIFVNLLVENNQLCQVYPLKRNSCDDMDSIALQARDMYKMQSYIDAQFGGPGKGFYRIVKNPFQARRVINAGKLAVIMGIETSRPFGCTFKHVPLVGDIPACDAADIDRQLDMVRRWGVRQMELTNKFDNALTGVAGDLGTTGVIVNGANFLETGTFWDMKHCEPADGESADRTQLTFPTISADQQDALFGAIGKLFGPVLPAVPLYGPPLHCNARGLTSLGEHTIKALAKRHMIFDPDHMSVKARKKSLNVIDAIKYPGVISSHSWSTPDAYPRIYKEGGFITPYAGDSTGFVEKWRQHMKWADKRFYWGIGYGADINGLGAQGNPRGAKVANPVTYPFRGLGGVKILKQHAGKRVYDINKDGVAQYGLYPDWIQDLRKVAERQHKGDGAKIVDDMYRGAEAYLQMWERAVGIKPDSCRNPGLRLPVAKVRKLVRRGMTTTQVMRKVGQPYRRLGHEFGVCAKTSTSKRVMVTIAFGDGGRVTGVRA